MTFEQFHNGLRLLTAIDMDELESAGLIERADWNAWAIFRRDPFRWMIRADDQSARKLFAIVAAKEGRRR